MIIFWTILAIVLIIGVMICLVYLELRRKFFKLKRRIDF